MTHSDKYDEDCWWMYGDLLNDDDELDEYIEEQRQEFHGDWFEYLHKFYE